MRQRGFLFLEAMVGLVVLVLIATCVTAGDQGQRAALLQSLEDLRDSRLAAGEIERLRAGRESLVAGRKELDRGHRLVKRLDPRLFEVVVQVGDVELVTWIAKDVR